MSEFNKVDRILEMQVIDWLQWSDASDSFDPHKATLALELIAKRKLAYEALEQKLDLATDAYIFNHSRVEALEQKLALAVEALKDFACMEGKKHSCHECDNCGTDLNDLTYLARDTLAEIDQLNKSSLE